VTVSNFKKHSADYTNTTTYKVAQHGESHYKGAVQSQLLVLGDA